MNGKETAEKRQAKDFSSGKEAAVYRKIIGTKQPKTTLKKRRRFISLELNFK